MDSLGMSCVKYLLFLFNLLFAVTGIVILTVGVLIHRMYNDYSAFIEEKFFFAPVLLIVVGVFVFVVAFFGCCGAIKESNCMLITFAGMLCLIFVLEAAGGITGYVMREDIHDMLETSMGSSMKNYNTNPDTTKNWDVLQFDLKCCGVDSPRDWARVFTNDSLPHSCCPTISLNESCKIVDANKVGCLPTLQSTLEHNTDLVGGFGIGVAFVQLVGVVFACCLARSIRREYETV